MKEKLFKFLKMLMKKLIKRVISPLLGKKFFYSFWENLYVLSLYGMNIGSGSYVDESGEKNVFAYLASLENCRTNRIVFDVGANIGNYTNALIEYVDNSNIEIHCFEPAAATFAALQNNVQFSNVILNQLGMSNQKTDAVLYYDREKSGLASVYQRQLDYYNITLDKSETIHLDTIDHYCADHRIERIDLLKLDVEGNEINVLMGAKRMLDNQKIQSIQFEFGGCNIDSRTFFKDFWSLLHESYDFYRILKNGFYKISKYSESLENFLCSNYFCTLK